jgi:hypothetical protein
MKILIPGWGSDNWTEDKQCLDCGTTLRLERSDLFYRNHDHFAGPHSIVSVVCCHCQEEIELHHYHGSDAEDQLKKTWGDIPNKGRTGWQAGE